MAFFAGHDGVLSEQREAREIVIVGHLFAPGGLVMALLAVHPELAFVRVVFLVAGNAGCSKLVAVEIASMAALAFDTRMRAVKRKFAVLCSSHHQRDIVAGQR